MRFILCLVLASCSGCGNFTPEEEQLAEEIALEAVDVGVMLETGYNPHLEDLAK